MRNDTFAIFFNPTTGLLSHPPTADSVRSCFQKYAVIGQSLSHGDIVTHADLRPERKVNSYWILKSRGLLILMNMQIE